MAEQFQEFVQVWLDLYRNIITGFGEVWQMLLIDTDFYELRVLVIGVFATILCIVIFGMAFGYFARRHF